MGLSADAEEFLSLPGTLRKPEEMGILLSFMPLDSPELFDLTFHASFASKMFILLKREGQNIQGFERMQQSLVESVQNVTSMLEQAEATYGIELGIRSKRADAVADFIADLTVLKEWMLARSQQ
ncbi:MAG TPA: hypothetical protein VEW28_05775 [Candidatus Kapabacteria bacterium]|nr:hypothetical protein [Candidatus Kapabacteria bacterium]